MATRRDLFIELTASGVHDVLCKELYTKHKVILLVDKGKVEAARWAVYTHQSAGVVIQVKRRRFWHHWRWLGYNPL